MSTGFRAPSQPAPEHTNKPDAKLLSHTHFVNAVVPYRGSQNILVRAASDGTKRNVRRWSGLRSLVPGKEMLIYNFNVFKMDHTVAAIQSVAMSNSRAIWPKIAELARNVGESGGQIRVTDQAGGLIVLVGVNSARRACGPSGSPTGESSRAA